MSCDDRGLLVVKDLPAGDYDLWLKGINQHIRLRLTQGAVRNGYVLGENRLLELRSDQSLQIADIETKEESLVVCSSTREVHTRALFSPLGMSRPTIRSGT